MKSGKCIDHRKALEKLKAYLVGNNSQKEETRE